jgi:protein-disulfide isomerase
MWKITVVVVAAAAFAGGYFVGKATPSSPSQKGSAPTAAPPTIDAVANADGVERKRVPVAGVPKGPAGAPITIVEFSDFQCPFSARATPTIDQLLKEYPGKIRFYFRHYPLPFHVNAPLAAEAALAAESQGKFWEMHDKLSANWQNLQREDLEMYAEELGLDMTRFKQALDTRQYKGRVDQDLAVVAKVGAKGTPAFFINGRLLSGAQPLEAFKTVVDEELASAQTVAAKKTPSLLHR